MQKSTFSFWLKLGWFDPIWSNMLQEPVPLDAYPRSCFDETMWGIDFVRRSELCSNEFMDIFDSFFSLATSSMSFYWICLLHHCWIHHYTEKRVNKLVTWLHLVLNKMTEQWTWLDRCKETFVVQKLFLYQAKWNY